MKVEQEEVGLVKVSEATQAFLGATFSGIMDNQTEWGATLQPNSLPKV